MPAKIYSPAKTAMQSGRGKTGGWILEFERQTARTIEPLMGYTSSSDTQTQIKMEFPTMAAAIAYANKAGIAYSVKSEREPKRRRPMTYSENFSFSRHIPWTH